MTYAVREIFYSLHGEGAHSGRPAVFCRFSGCNLWSGRECDRAAAICPFCDTRFVGVDGSGGGHFGSAVELARAVDSHWPASANGRSSKFVVATGGEPLLQLDDQAIAAFHARGFEVAVETNGTCPPPSAIDWLSVSPKAGADLVIVSGNELKLVFPQAGGEPERYESLDFDRFFLQPMDGPHLAENTQSAAAHCLAHPHWELSLQAHKLIGLR